MKKILSLMFALLLLSAVFTLYPFAEGEDIIAEEVPAEETIVEYVTEEVPTVTETIVSWFYDNSDNVFTGFTMAISMVLAYLFKKGLLPSLTNGLSKMNTDLGSGVDRLATIADAFSKSTDERLQEIGGKMEPFLEKARTVEDISAKMETALVDMQAQIKASDTDRQIVEKTLRLQTEMLYSVFISANLPEYQKQQLGARYNEMQSLIDSLYQGEKNEEAEQ